MSQGNWKPQFPRPKANDGAWFKGLNLALSFATTLAVSLFITWKVGQWVDVKLGSNIVFTVIFVLIGIISSFRVFIRELEKFENPTRKRDD